MAGMLFSATHACPTCMLRFARRTRCPECGGARVLSLHTQEERADFEALRRRARRALRESRGAAAVLATLAEWAPARARFPIVFGLFLFVPASVVLVRYGLSLDDAWEVAGLAIAGALVLAFTVLARLSRSASEAPGEPRKLLVHTSSASTPHATTLRGVVRHASMTLESPIGGTPCVVFGLHGDVDGAQIDDAEGGDFDLELESGERVMVSLEHAILVTDEAIAPSIVPRTALLDELLDERGIGLGEASGTVRVAEVVVREGDVVTVEAEVVGGVALSFGERAPSRARLASGGESSPLRVRLGTIA